MKLFVVYVKGLIPCLIIFDLYCTQMEKLYVNINKCFMLVNIDIKIP